jgi:hypothetical protein
MSEVISLAEVPLFLEFLCVIFIMCVEGSHNEAVMYIHMLHFQNYCCHFYSGGLGLKIGCQEKKEAYPQL